MSNNIEKDFGKVLEYHAGSKHHPERFAPGPGQLDWANEPDPFRRYQGAPLLRLPFPAQDPDINHFALYRRLVRPRQLTLPAVATLLELSLGLSAWKSYQGGSWSLRINPSSGDLHPTECHLILPPVDGSAGGVFHYDCYHHALELRASPPPEIWGEGRVFFGNGGFLIGLSSIVWRVTWLNAVADSEIATLLGFGGIQWPEQEQELPQCLLLVQPGGVSEAPRDLPPGWLSAFSGLPFAGEPNRLSSGHRAWPAIERVIAATLKPHTPAMNFSQPESGYLEEQVPDVTAAGNIRGRRSAVDFDRHSALSGEDFFAILDKTLPRAGSAPFDLGLGESRVHLLLFVHRVQGVEPGLYFLLRNEADLAELQQERSPGLGWERVAAAGSLPLLLLRKGDCRTAAVRASCDQDIAGDGAFAVAMIARFRSLLEEAPWLYRRLHWEAGMIGQVLYLEAEAHGMAGTGIGCFFDDVTHRLLGLSGDAFQDIYHFTVGNAVDDHRITTRPPYYHLRQA